MCHRLSYRRLLPASLVVGFAAMACGGTETPKPATENAQGGKSGTTNVQGGSSTAASETGGASAGGATPVGMGGDYGTASAGTATAGGASAGGATPTSTGGTSGNATLPQCDATQVRRDINVRVAYPEGLSAPTPLSLSYGDAVTHQVDGTLQSITEITESCPACTNGTRQALSIPLVDDAGESWALVAYPIDLVTGWAAATKPLVGQRLSLMFRYTRAFQYSMSTGFVLSDAAGPVIIAEQAQNITALKPADLPGFTVALGEPICSAPYGCATNVFAQLVIAGASTVSLGLNQDSELTLGSQRYMARNGGAGYLIVGTCQDLERASPWSMWRASN